jgi:hypothetical protein
VLLRRSYLAFTGVLAAMRLLPVCDTDKDIEILVLRHQLAILQRQKATSIPLVQSSVPVRAALAKSVASCTWPRCRAW